VRFAGTKTPPAAVAAAAKSVVPPPASAPAPVAVAQTTRVALPLDVVARKPPPEEDEDPPFVDRDEDEDGYGSENFEELDEEVSTSEFNVGKKPPPAEAAVAGARPPPPSSSLGAKAPPTGAARPPPLGLGAGARREADAEDGLSVDDSYGSSFAAPERSTASQGSRYSDVRTRSVLAREGASGKRSSALPPPLSLFLRRSRA